MENLLLQIGTRSCPSPRPPTHPQRFQITRGSSVRIRIDRRQWPPQLTGTIEKKKTGKNQQVLDKLKVERERGITGEVLGYIRGASLRTDTPV
jgi:hypothetical protein